MNVVFRIRAEADLAEIAECIARDNPVRAESFVNEIVDHCLAIVDRPFAPRERPELGDGVRLIVHGMYVVLYRIEGEDVLVLRAVHGRRDLTRLEI